MISCLRRLIIASTTNRGEYMIPFFSTACLSIIIIIQVDISAGIGPFRYHREYAFPFWTVMVINVDVKLGALGSSLTATAVYRGWQADLELGLKRVDNVHGDAAARGHGVAAGNAHEGGAARGHEDVITRGHGVAAGIEHEDAAARGHGIATGKGM